MACKWSTENQTQTHIHKKSKSKSLRWKSPACMKERLSTSAHTSQSPTRNEKKEKQQRLMRIRRVVSHAFRPAPSPPEANRSTSKPPSDPPPLSLLLLRCNLCLVFVILFKIFIAWQCSLVASWCTLCVGTPKFSRAVMVFDYVTPSLDHAGCVITTGVVVFFFFFFLMYWL